MAKYTGYTQRRIKPAEPKPNPLEETLASPHSGTPNPKPVGVRGKIVHVYEQQNQQENLTQAFERRGVKVRPFENEHYVDPTHILRIRKGPQGQRVYLCYEETPKGKFYYILRATEKTSDWKDITDKFKSD